MTIRVPTNGKPSNPDNRMWAWGLLGSVLMPFNSFVPGISTGFLIGGLLGTVTGHEKRKREIDTGFKEIRSPTLLNGGFAKNLLIGAFILTALMVGAAVVAVISAGGSAAVAGSIAMNIATGSALAPTVTTALYSAAIEAAGMVGLLGVVPNLIMAWKGAKSRKNEMKQDYQEGINVLAELKKEQSISISRDKEQEPSLSESVSEQQAKAQKYQFDNSKLVDQRGDRKWVNDGSERTDMERGQTIS